MCFPKKIWQHEVAIDFNRLVLKLTRDQGTAEPDIKQGILHGENLEK